MTERNFRPTHRRGAFTFVEILAALVFLGILMPAVITGLTLSSRASIAAERTATATQLAENQLAQAMLDGSWQTGGTKGDFGPDWKDFRWELTRGDWAADSMSELTLTVRFSVQGRDQSVRLTTLASENAQTTQ